MNTESTNFDAGIRPAQLEQLREYDTALLANLLGFVDPTPAHTWYMSNTIRSLTPALDPTVGVAVTCKMDTSTPNHLSNGNAEGYWQQLEQMEALDVPTVWVVECVGTRPRHECVAGDGMAKTLSAAGCVGLVTNGGVRDLPGLLSTSFAAYGTGVTIHHCKLRVRRLGAPVDVGGITIRSGDVIHAGAEGVIKISPEAIDLLLQRAPDYRAFEHEAHQMMRRTDISAAEKRQQLDTLIERYGFKDCASG